MFPAIALPEQNLKSMEEMNIIPQGQGEIVLYQPDENTHLEVRVEEDTVWLTQSQIALLFGTKRPAITKHLNNIFKSGELEQNSVSSILEHTAADGKTYKTLFYNLDAILSVGYRVNSVNATIFRRWANTVLKQYLLRGYAVHQQIIQLEHQIDTRLMALQEHTDNRLRDVENRLQRDENQIDFIVRTNQPPKELLIPTGCVWDAWNFLSELIRGAKQRIILIDNFVDERTLSLLDKRGEGVCCTVHTRYNAQTVLDFEKHNAQCAPIGRVQLTQAVHDRYLIVDETVWLLGASVKDMGRGLCTVIRIGFQPEEIMSRL